MKQFIRVLIFLFFTAAVYGAAKPPAWYDSLETVYPENRYIAQIGYGKTRQDAEADALAHIAGFFQTTVSTHIESQESFVSKNGNQSTSKELTAQTIVQSQMDLFAVEYSKPYTDKSSRQTAIVAYIDRNKAWHIYESKMKAYTDAFLHQYTAADAKRDPLQKYLLFSAAKESADDFLLGYGLGMLLAPVNCKAAYSAINTEVLALKAKMNDLKTACMMRVSVTGDTDNIIQRKITELLSSEGFAVQKQQAPYEVRAEYIAPVSASKDEYGEVFISYPGIEISIEHNGAAVFSYSKTCGKIAAFTRQKNSTMSYQKIEKELEASFLAEFSTFINAK